MSQELWISPSQINTFQDCPRKWWLERVARLPTEPGVDHFTFGTILHGCLERWMSGTEQGRVPSAFEASDRTGKCPWGFDPVGKRWTTGPLVGQKFGAPVEVYPEGWQTHVEKGNSKTISDEEAKHIRHLVEQAIERGVVVRDPEQSYERSIEVAVIPGVKLVGKVDLSKWHEIHDHKSFGNDRYIKREGPEEPIDAPFAREDERSPNCVGDDQQLLTYAWALTMMDGWTGVVTLRHNQFPKKSDDRRGVRSVSAKVTHGRVMAHGEDVKSVAAEMVRVAAIEKFADTPGPKDVGACSKYGGCSFVPICSRHETIPGYVTRVESLLAKAGTNFKPHPMGIFNKKVAPQTAPAAAAAPAAKPTQNTSKSPSALQAAKAAAQPAASTGGAPWANPQCPSCKGTGINHKGLPCGICDKTAEKGGRPRTGWYEFVQTEEGYFATALESHRAQIEALGAEVEWFGEAEVAPPTKQEAARDINIALQTKAAAQEVEEVQEASPQPQEPSQAPAAPKPRGRPSKAAAAASGEAKESGGRSPGRPPAGLMILKGCHLVTGPERPRLSAVVLLERVGAEFAAAQGVDSYWQLDTWKRRDGLRGNAGTIAATLGKTIIEVSATPDPDVASLIAGLEPHAEWVVEA